MAVKIVVDGKSSIVKSVLQNCLLTGRYEVPPLNTWASYRYCCDVVVNHVEHHIIWDVSDLNHEQQILLCESADVIVQLFAIDDPSSLKTSLDISFACFQLTFSGKPMLLVGCKADLRDTKNARLFPVELGSLLAGYAGAVKYMECSSVPGFDVHNVFEEAVRCSLNESNLEVIDKHLHAVMNLSDIGAEWIDVCDFRLGTAILFPFKKAQFKRHDMEKVQHIVSQIKSESDNNYKDIIIYCVLEFDRLLISQGFRGMCFTGCEGSMPTCTLWCVHSCSSNPTLIVQCRLFSVDEPHENVVCSKCPANLRFFANDCKSIASFLGSRDHVKVKSLIIVNCFGKLNFSFLAKLTGLEHLIIVNNEVDLATLTFPPHLHGTMKHLVLNNCGITQATDVPSEIGKLVNLEILSLANNNFKKIPTPLASLTLLHTLLIDQANVCFPPRELLKRPVHEIISYLGSLKECPVANKVSKLIVVGQEKVGKSTLVKAMKRSRWLTNNEPPAKTDGVDISMLTLEDIHCKVYDLAGDVEYLNTHSLFLSPNTLQLIVFDLSRVIVHKRARSADHLCRLQLWLETIASRDPKSKVILVGTHADHSSVSEEILNKNRKLLAEVLMKYSSSHKALYRNGPCDECFICNPKSSPQNLECFMVSTENICGEDSKALSNTASQIPHVLGYFEVSSIKQYPSSLLKFDNINIEKLKSLVASSIVSIMKTSEIDQIPERWLSFRKYIAKKLSSDDGLRQKPLMPLSQLRDIALELEIHAEEMMIAMLRFFHCQGTYLWYEDLPEMKDRVILDPQWLSNQLRALISHRSSVNSIYDGVLHLSELPKVWGQMSENDRQNILALFRSVGLCFSISDTEELFPCNLPVGWPDREIWPPVPHGEENQTSLLFKFSFVPPSFFPDLTGEVNKKNETFAKNVKPLYYRFHIVYITKDNSLEPVGKENTEGEDAIQPTQHPLVLPYKVHYELMPYNNSLTVAVRGHDPPSILPDIRATIEIVKRHHYPGITYSERMLCPECVMNRVQPPASFSYDIPHDGVCSQGHIVGSNQTILQGRYSSAKIVPSSIAQTGRVMGETLDDHICPKLFVVLPINVEGLSLKDRFVYSYIRDGFAVHLLCECPDQWHFVDSPGFRVGKPKEFFEKYGSRVCKALRVISTFSTPIRSASSLDLHCQAAAAVGAVVNSASQDLLSLFESYLDKYPHLERTLGSSRDDLKDLKSSSGLQRSELSRFLELEAKGRNFGPLVCTYVGKHNEWLWLCEEHSERFEIVKRESESD